MKTDVVCGTLVEENVAAEAGLTTVQGDKTYYFCGYDCKLRFDAEPELFFKEPTLDQQRQDSEGGPAYTG